MNLIENQRKYGLKKAVSFTIDQWNHDYKNLLLLKDSVEPWKIKSVNTWLQFEKMFILIN